MTLFNSQNIDFIEKTCPSHNVLTGWFCAIQESVTRRLTLIMSNTLLLIIAQNNLINSILILKIMPNSMNLSLFLVTIMFFHLLAVVTITRCEDQENKPKINETKSDEEKKEQVPQENTSINATTSGLDKFSNYISRNSAMLKRAFYVFVAVGAILMVYFGIRLYRSKKRRVKSYGLLHSSGENYELNPLNVDSDDDYTVFEAKSLR
ncbi:uncharacterized protein LOC143463550 [Clavelina lepadiformis]|uniref:Uncharacterized protein n=1 Tax=Clavelina lepadiformis TaxID=159417 RepID=A0ABP0FQL6_CLALP